MADMRITHSGSTPSGETTEPRRNGRARCAAIAAAGVCVVAVVVASCAGEADRSGSDDAVRSDPAAVIDDYRIAYNDGDVDRVMALFADDAELTRHPFAARSSGHAAIRSIQLRDLAVAAPSDAYRLYDVEVSGDTVTWDHEFTNADGDRWCGQGNVAVITDGRIESWAFAPNPRRC